MQTATTWSQTYDPLGNLWLSGLVAAIPILFFFAALTVLKLKGHVAGTITLLLAMAVAVTVFGMPAGMALAAAIYGFCYGLWPIAWIIVGAVFLYKVSVETGQFAIIRRSILAITQDQRLQLLLVGFAFGAFLEGAAGFGAPIAITAALLVGLGFKPLHAAGLCLIANAAPVAYGAMGIPIIVAGEVTGIGPFAIGQMAGRQLPLLALLIPFWLVFVMDGMRGVQETWPAVLVAGGSFATVQSLTANHVGPELPDILAGLATLICLPLFLRFWKPARVFRFEDAGEAGMALPAQDAAPVTRGQVVRAWSPFLILTAFVTLWSIAPFKRLFAPDGPLSSMVAHVSVPLLDGRVLKGPPIAAQATQFPADYKFDWFSGTGTAIFIAALVTLLVLGLRPRRALVTFAATVRGLLVPIYSIGTVLAFAFVANYSGLSATLALPLAQTGRAFTFFSPFLGWLGVFLTGSDTSANALFGALQATTARQIGVSDVLLVAVNTTGGGTGKMISPQSIAIACGAVGLVGRESALFRFTVKHSLLFAGLIGVLTTVQAYLLPWMIP
ncbi:lactate permease LctP family transporter [Sphingobium yanoikuyae]|uniref:lactate permease LctP family transporter n=1 Tax=Sphingobium yanoikuyae TaxID=13690 RepID=UPI00293C91F5|nr:lactate permease LctP family transporter [Sphingobium yanoikuyae]MDV3482218.1 lactate permease LctP family transporter [Sphingobium yanoikuyae]